MTGRELARQMDNTDPVGLIVAGQLVRVTGAKTMMIPGKGAMTILETHPILYATQKKKL